MESLIKRSCLYSGTKLRSIHFSKLDFFTLKISTKFYSYGQLLWLSICTQERLMPTIMEPKPLILWTIHEPQLKKTVFLWKNAKQLLFRSIHVQLSNSFLQLVKAQSKTHGTISSYILLWLGHLEILLYITIGQNLNEVQFIFMLAILFK